VNLNQGVQYVNDGGIAGTLVSSSTATSNVNLAYGSALQTKLNENLNHPDPEILNNLKSIGIIRNDNQDLKMLPPQALKRVQYYYHARNQNEYQRVGPGKHNMPMAPSNESGLPIFAN